jgi:type IV secretory pathway component VirB8
MTIINQTIYVALIIKNNIMNPTIKLLYTTCILSFFSSFAFGQNETEPNNTLQTANAITLSTTVSVQGNINPEGDLDFYKFTIPRS